MANRVCILIIFSFSWLFSCSPAGSRTESTNQNDQTGNGGLSTFIFGHSLINHEHHHENYVYESQETSVPHWMGLLAAHDSREYSVAGQYGFLGNHADLPPIPQWGFDSAPSAWSDDDGRQFHEVNFNSVLLTAANFIQYQSPDENYYQSDVSPLDLTDDIFQWVTQQEPGIDLYIYENWPDMASFISGDSQGTLSAYDQPARALMVDYNSYTLGEFHTWWMDYYRATEELYGDVQMIPVGPIIAELIGNSPVGEIPLNELYEDDAPHGMPNIYFLAALITYMDMYGTQAPMDYAVPEIISPVIRSNYSNLVQYIWQRLEFYHDEFTQ